MRPIRPNSLKFGENAPQNAPQNGPVQTIERRILKRIFSEFETIWSYKHPVLKFLNLKSDYIVDFSRVTSIDSVGIVRLLDQSKGRRVHLVAAQSDVRKSLESYEGFSDRHISFHASMIDAHSTISS